MGIAADLLSAETAYGAAMPDTHSGADLRDVVLKGRFRLIERIGAGGTSSVYRAIDMRKLEVQAPDPYVAVKILHMPERGRREPLALLEQEVHKARTLTHPNIVRVYDFGHDGALVFIVMECLEGVLLRSMIAAGEFPLADETRSLDVIRSLANALAFAHAQRIVHGDLEPGNVFVTTDGMVKLMDFGIARACRQSDPPKVEARKPGSDTDGHTSVYASPEQLEGAKPDPVHDVYALACISYELLTGRHPFAKRSGVVARDLGLEVPAHSAVSLQQHTALERALAFDPQKRTPSAATFADELMRVPSGRRIPPRIAAVLAALGVVAVLAYWAVMHPESAKPAWSRAPPAGLPGAGTRLQDCAVCPPLLVLGGDAGGALSTDNAAAGLVAVAVNEVTVGEFGSFVMAKSYMPASGCMEYAGDWVFNEQRGWRDPGFLQTESHPVTCVSWSDAQAYVAWLSEETGESYRLLSAEEWTYAAAVDPKQEFCEIANGADRTAENRFPGWQVADCSDAYVFTAPVASFSANARGINDTAGNVFEWIADCADSSCKTRQLRGGSWFSDPTFTDPDTVNQFEPDTRASTFGIRVARDLRP